MTMIPACLRVLGRPLQPARHQVTLSVDGQRPRWVVNQQILQTRLGAGQPLSDPQAHRARRMRTVKRAERARAQALDIEGVKKLVAEQLKQGTISRS